MLLQVTGALLLFQLFVKVPGELETLSFTCLTWVELQNLFLKLLVNLKSGVFFLAWMEEI